jgi:hypothetical protein
MDVEELIVNVVADTVPNFTVDPVTKPVPVMVTELKRVSQRSGLTDVTVGAAYAKRSAELVAEVPSPVTVTVIFTVPVPAGAVAVIEP